MSYFLDNVNNIDVNEIIAILREILKLRQDLKYISISKFGNFKASQ